MFPEEAAETMCLLLKILKKDQIEGRRKGRRIGDICGSVSHPKLNCSQEILSLKILDCPMPSNGMAFPTAISPAVLCVRDLSAMPSSISC